jgi:hypothetical protein
MSRQLVVRPIFASHEPGWSVETPDDDRHYKLWAPRPDVEGRPGRDYWQVSWYRPGRRSRRGRNLPRCLDGDSGGGLRAPTMAEALAALPDDREGHAARRLLEGAAKGPATS